MVLSINYAPEPTGFAPHVADLCEHLSSRGHAVTVLTGFPFAPYWSRWKEYRRKFVLRELIDNVEVLRLTHFIPKRPRKLLQRLLMEGTFCLLAAIILFLRRHRKIDVILYVGAQPSIAMLSRLVAQWRRVPYVVAINDLASQAAGDVGIAKARILQEILVAFEYAAYRRASGAMVLCSSFRDELAARGYPANRIRIIPSPVDLKQIHPISNGIAFREAHALSPNDFVVLYSGSMGLKQGMTNVVEAARILRNSDPAAKWVLVGDGELRPIIENLIADYALKEFVRLLPFQAESEMSAMYSAADVLLLNQLSKVKDTVMPSKLLTYLAAGRPVLASVNPASQGAMLLREAGGGVIVPPENPGALAMGVIRLRSDAETLKVMGQRNRQYAEKHFDRRQIFVAQEDFLAETVKTASLSVNKSQFLL